MPFAVQSMLSAHMAERAATLMKSGERPGEKVLAERESILPLFGPMLEAMLGGLFEQQIPNVPVYRETEDKCGLAVDLGCGKGWYLRRLATCFPHLRGIGLDGFEENISLRPEEIEAEFHRVGMETGVYLFADGNEAVIVGRKA